MPYMICKSIYTYILSLPQARSEDPSHMIGGNQRQGDLQQPTKSFACPFLQPTFNQFLWHNMCKPYQKLLNTEVWVIVVYNIFQVQLCWEIWSWEKYPHTCSSHLCSPAWKIPKGASAAHGPRALWRSSGPLWSPGRWLESTVRSESSESYGSTAGSSVFVRSVGKQGCSGTWWNKNSNQSWYQHWTGPPDCELEPGVVQRNSMILVSSFST